MNSSFNKYPTPPAKSHVLFPPSAPHVKSLLPTWSVRLSYVTNPLLLQVLFTEILKPSALKMPRLWSWLSIISN